MWLRIVGVGMLIALLALLAGCGQTDSDRIHSNDASGTFRTPPAVSASGQESPSGNGSASAGSEQGGGQVGGGGQTGGSQGNGPAPCPTAVQLASGGNPAATPVGCSTVTPVNAVATP